MIEYLIELDKSLFFFLNGLHSSWMDPIMFWISDKKIWIPFYLFLAGWIIKTFNKKSIIYLLALGLAITITDQVISGFMKGFFERFRPSRDPENQGMVHIVNGYTGGKYGFASSHSGNAFALAMFIYLTFREYKWVWLMFVWAAIVAYSRVYLGVHYPGDILVGGIIGLIFGKLCHRLAEKVIAKY
ncbi:phosphatase PAP2 family protein [Fulvivirga lutea]|uniref:Phosphatase PAP2 family protein n=1 Tax=Fulvivirga lutea TaxID=2810512 RepID=A0A974WIR8_9BACT|nr:phosphatase PAP2 family protein [Fulvivirga lutea]QSE96905.1 phosphatase PAP2 family protein [Fulvivirga lutea]